MKEASPQFAATSMTHPARLRQMALRLVLPFISVLLLSTTGCLTVLTSKHSVPVPMAPSTIKSASADELVAQLNDHWARFESLTATVDIRASHLKSKEGTATDYPSFRANILVRKPEMLRILGKAPIVQTEMFDLASDGTHFTLKVPPRNKVYQGLSAVPGSSPNWYENLRPGFLFSAMVVRGLAPDEQYSVISDTETVMNPAMKRLVSRPDYLLNIVRPKANSAELYPVRVVRFHRDDLLPYEQDLYDNHGTLQTQVIYGPYKDFGGSSFPATITLNRPQEDYQLIMTVERVAFNPILTDDQFQIKIPKGSVITVLQ